MTSVLFSCEISVMASFVRLYNLNDGKFVPLRDFKDNRFCFVTIFLRLLVLFSYKISMIIVFCSIARSQ